MSAKQQLVAARELDHIQASGQIMHGTIHRLLTLLQQAFDAVFHTIRNRPCY